MLLELFQSGMDLAQRTLAYEFFRRELDCEPFEDVSILHVSVAADGSGQECALVSELPPDTSHCEWLELPLLVHEAGRELQALLEISIMPIRHSGDSRFGFSLRAEELVRVRSIDIRRVVDLLDPNPQPAPTAPSPSPDLGGIEERGFDPSTGLLQPGPLRRLPERRLPTSLPLDLLLKGPNFTTDLPGTPTADSLDVVLEGLVTLGVPSILQPDSLGGSLDQTDQPRIKTLLFLRQFRLRPEPNEALERILPAAGFLPASSPPVKLSDDLSNTQCFLGTCRGNATVVLVRGGDISLVSVGMVDSGDDGQLLDDLCRDLRLVQEHQSEINDSLLYGLERMMADVVADFLE